MTDFDWGEFAVESEFPEAFKFTNPDDSIVGTIIKIRRATFPDATVPELWIRLDDGTERSVLASQRNLQAKLAEARPATGDRIAIVFRGLGDAKPGKSAPKLFDVEVGAKSAPTEAPAAQSTPSTASAASLLG